MVQTDKGTINSASRVQHSQWVQPHMGDGGVMSWEKRRGSWERKEGGDG